MRDGNQLPLLGVGPLEGRVLRALWTAGAWSSVGDVQASLNSASQKPLSYSTVKAVLLTLTKKGHTAKKTEGRANLFSAKLSREEYERQAVARVVRPLMRTHRSPLLAQIVDEVVADHESLANLQIADCPGYNDQGLQLANVVPASGTTFQNYTYGYHGPVEFYTAPQSATISSITVDDHTTFLTSGSFVLQPGEYAAITWSPAGTFVPSFVMIGK